MDEPHKTAVALFNYAHTYAQSAVTLEKHETRATHSDAPIYFLYFHAIELYLKSFLVRHGHDLDDLKKRQGHRVQPLAEMCQTDGLQLPLGGHAVIDQMESTDNVITSRYIRLGNHTRLPLSAYYDFCLSLHRQIGQKVYEGSGVTRLPVLARTDSRG